MNSIPNFRMVDVEIITDLAKAIELIVGYRVIEVRTEADYWRLYGNLTVVWEELNQYMNKNMKEEA